MKNLTAVPLMVALMLLIVSSLMTVSGLHLTKLVSADETGEPPCDGTIVVVTETDNVLGTYTTLECQELSGRRWRWWIWVPAGLGVVAAFAFGIAGWQKGRAGNSMSAGANAERNN